MKKKVYMNPKMLQKQYRKFCNLQKRISLLMNNGEFYSLTCEMRNRLIRRLKILYKRISQLANKQKLRWAGAAMALILSASIAHAGYNDPISLTGMQTQTGYSGIEYADVDGDSDLDLVVGNDDGTISYYKNNNGDYTKQTGSSNPFNGINTGYTYNSPAITDVDGDGDLDLLIGNSNVEPLYYRNDAGTYNNITGASNPFDGLPIGLGAVPRFVNVDGDSDMDLVAGAFDGTIVYFENSGGNYTEISGVDNPFNGIDAGTGACPFFNDYDGDSDLDLFIGTKDGTVLCYQNSSEVFTQQTGSNNPFGAVSTETEISILVNDVDSDGDVDLILGDEGTNIRYFENEGSSVTERTGTLNPFEGVFMDSGSHTMADIDGDSDMDLIVCGNNDMFFYENINGEFIPDTVNNPFKTLGLANIHAAFADLDGDSDQDMVVGNADGELRYFLNNMGTFVELTGASNPFNGIDVGDNAYPTLGYYDNDDNLDLFVGNKAGEIDYYEKDGSSFVARTGSNNPFDGLDIGGSAYPVLVDLDGDNDLDMAVGEASTDTLNYFQNNAGVMTQLTNSANPFDNIGVDDNISASFADIDNDGDLDLFLSDNNKLYFIEYATPGVSVNTNGSVVTSESGGSDTFTLVLDSQPSADVVISLASSNTSEGTVSPAAVTFTTSNWNTPQEITVTGVDDSEDDGNIDYSISLTVTSSDADYNGMAVTNVQVNNSDDEGPVAVESNTVDNYSVYVNNKTVVINSDEVIQKVNVYSITGTLITSEYPNNSGTHEMYLYDTRSGIYLIQVTVNGKVSTKKVILK